MIERIYKKLTKAVTQGEMEVGEWGEGGWEDFSIDNLFLLSRFLNYVNITHFKGIKIIFN